MIRTLTPFLLLGPLSAGLDAQTTAQFAGVKADKGTASYGTVDGRRMLTLSDDFVVPDTPAPHWQVVDTSGNAFLLQRLEIKEGVFHKGIELPGYVTDVAKVQIWCAFAETLLGEAAFPAPVAGNVGERHVSTPFAGVKANKGSVSHVRQGSRSLLTLSDDFVVPDTPAPHWQVVDSKGRKYLLQRLVVKDGKLNETITVPSYVPDVASVQIWCSFAETLLGEASFSCPVM